MSDELLPADAKIHEGTMIVEPDKRAIPFFQDRTKPFVTNYLGDSKLANWRFSAMVKGGRCKSLLDSKDESIKVRFYYCHPVTLNAGDGEIVDAIRTVLVTPDNECYETVSETVANFVADLFNFFDHDRPLDPPLEVKVIRKRTRAKFETIVLEPVL